jgi:hypothetical protein
LIAPTCSIVRRRSASHGAPAGRVGEQREPVGDRALVVAAEVPLDREEVARARVLRVERGGLAERRACRRRQRVARARHHPRLAERGPQHRAGWIRLRRFLVGRGGVGEAVAREVGEAELLPRAGVVGLGRGAGLERGERVGNGGSRRPGLVRRAVEQPVADRRHRQRDRRDRGDPAAADPAQPACHPASLPLPSRGR